MKKKDYTITEAMPKVGINRLSMYNNINKGKLKATKHIINGREAYLIAQDDLEAFITKRKTVLSLRA
jgi:predicted DNA-binding protein (UPF0251 family)